MALHDLLDEGQADASPLFAFLGTLQTFENAKDFVMEFRRDPPSVVPDSKDNLAVFGRSDQPDVPVRIGKLGRVAQ